MERRRASACPSEWLLTVSSYAASCSEQLRRQPCYKHVLDDSSYGALWDIVILQQHLVVVSVEEYADTLRLHVVEGRD
jgi:hypothetical protein